MDIVVKGRHLEVSDRFRDHVSDKLSKVEKLDSKVQRVDVEVSKESNPRLADRAFRVELTIRSKGPVVRAEAAADDKYAALDLAIGKLEGRLRRAADRRHRLEEAGGPATAPRPSRRRPCGGGSERGAAPGIVGEGPMVVREKVHTAHPMTLDQALYEMELVGHDFYLFSRRRDRPPVRGLPPPRLRLRRDPPRPRRRSADRRLIRPRSPPPLPGPRRVP